MGEEVNSISSKKYSRFISKYSAGSRYLGGRIVALICTLFVLFFSVGCSGGGGGKNNEEHNQSALAGDAADTAQHLDTELPSNIPIAALPRWEAQMVNFGGLHCRNLGDSSIAFDPKLAATYYDAQWVFLQIVQYTGDNQWNHCADLAEVIYRDRYLIPNDGFIPGFWIFPHGLTLDYLQNGDEVSKAAAVGMSRNAAFARDSTPAGDTVGTPFSREVAYALMSYLSAEDMGEPRRLRLPLLVNQALGHLEQWFVTENAPFLPPFMVGLTSHALIMYHQRTGDPRVIPALTNAADRLWEMAWLPGAQAFSYSLPDNPEAAPDLNLLIAPLYAWLYHRTGEERFLTRGDQIFAGGVRGAYLFGGKQFNQNYRWSFEYVRLRSVQPLR